MNQFENNKFENNKNEHVKFLFDSYYSQWMFLIVVI